MNEAIINSSYYLRRVVKARQAVEKWKSHQPGVQKWFHEKLELDEALEKELEAAAAWVEHLNRSRNERD